MSKKPSNEFNAKAKQHLFSVVVAGADAKKDLSAKTKAAAEEVRKLAKNLGIEERVDVKLDPALDKTGVFFLRAPEKFAARVKKLDSIETVEKPAARKALPASKGTGSTRPRKKK